MEMLSRFVDREDVNLLILAETSFCPFEDDFMGYCYIKRS